MASNDVRSNIAATLTQTYEFVVHRHTLGYSAHLFDFTQNYGFLLVGPYVLFQLM